MKIAEVLKSWRKDQGYSVDGAAYQIGVPADTYRRLELGQDNLQLKTAQAIAAWLLSD